MANEVKMKALKSWRNKAFEGVIMAGATFHTTEGRARVLDREGLAVRFPDRIVVQDDFSRQHGAGDAGNPDQAGAALNDEEFFHDPRQQGASVPLEQAAGQTGEQPALSSSSLPDRPQNLPISTQSARRNAKKK